MDEPGGRVGGRGAAAAALFLSALVLRPQVIGVAPLLPRIRADLAVPHGVAGLLGSIPVLCMGVFALFGPLLARRLGTRLTIGASLATIGICGLVRSVAGSTLSLVVTTLGIGVAIGVAGAVLPIVVKERFADRPALGTGTYTGGIQLGAALSAAAAIPLAQAGGGWRASIATFSAATLLITVVWFALVRANASGGGMSSSWLPAGSTIAVALAGLFAVQSVPYYAFNSWLPAYLLERGWSETAGGGLLGALNVGSLTACFIVPLAAERFGSRRAYLMGASCGLSAAILGLLLMPRLAPVWVPCAGLCLGALFTLALTLPLDVGKSREEVGAIAALMLCAGYSLSAVTPVVLGAIRDATDSFVPGFWLTGAFALLLIPTCAWFSPERLGRRPAIEPLTPVEPSAP